VNEPTVACVDPNVIDAAAVDVETRAEEHNITGQYGIQRHWMRRALLLVGGTRHFEPRAFVHISHESAAIESTRVSATKMIGGSDKRSGLMGDHNTALVVRLGRTRNSAAARDQPDYKDQERTAKAKPACSL
jgi:hypothetical protein